eukprot:4249024-Pyramimonas_sp.AAC.1
MPKSHLPPYLPPSDLFNGPLNGPYKGAQAGRRGAPPTQSPITCAAVHVRRAECTGVSSAPLPLLAQEDPVELDTEDKQEEDDSELGNCLHL